MTYILSLAIQIAVVVAVVVIVLLLARPGRQHDSKELEQVVTRISSDLACVQEAIVAVLNTRISKSVAENRQATKDENEEVAKLVIEQLRSLCAEQSQSLGSIAGQVQKLVAESASRIQSDAGTISEVRHAVQEEVQALADRVSALERDLAEQTHEIITQLTQAESRIGAVVGSQDDPLLGVRQQVLILRQELAVFEKQAQQLARTLSALRPDDLQRRETAGRSQLLPDDITRTDNAIPSSAQVPGRHIEQDLE